MLSAQRAAHARLVSAVTRGVFASPHAGAGRDAERGVHAIAVEVDHARCERVAEIRRCHKSAPFSRAAELIGSLEPEPYVLLSVSHRRKVN